MAERRIDGLWRPLGSFRGSQGGLWGPPGAFGEVLGGDFQAAVALCFRYSPRGCRGFWALHWGRFFHRFLVSSCRVGFRSQTLSSGLSWLFGLRLETQAFDLKQAVVLQVMFRFGKKQPLKKQRKKRLSTALAWLFVALVFEPFGSHFCPLRRQFLAAAELCFRCSPRGSRGFLGSLVGGKLALTFCVVPLRLFSSANALLGALVAFRGPFWDAFLINF